MPEVVPDACLEADIAVVAQKGAGKTYAMKGLVERNLVAGRRTIILDPLNSWWGLKAKADGSPGFPIVVIGGPNGDVPLDPARGELLAAFLADNDLSAVVDVSELKREALLAFAQAFLAELYRRNRTPLTLVLEEADVFAPQNPASSATRAMHDEVDQIARRGRARGFRLWTITQRPARLSKDVLTQTSTLLLLRIRSPQDRAAAQDWIKGHAAAEQAAEINASLASLPTGEGYVWSPDLDLLQRVRFPAIGTLDTSATPQHGERRPWPQAQLALVAGVVDQLRQVLAGEVALVEPAPPSAEASAYTAAHVQQLVDQAREEGRQAGYGEGFDIGFARAKVMVIPLLQKAIGDVEGLARVRSITAETVGASLPPAKAAPRAKPAPAKAPPSPPATPPAGDMTEAAARLLSGARFAHRQVTWPEAALLSGTIPGGGYFNRTRKELTEGGFPEPPTNDLVEDGPSVMPEELLASLGVKLRDKGGAAERVFTFLWRNGPASKDRIAQDLGLSPGGGFWNRTWKTLRDHPAVQEKDGAWDIAPVLRELATVYGGKEDRR